MIITRKYSLLAALTLSVVLCGLTLGVRAQHRTAFDLSPTPALDVRSCIAPHSLGAFTVSPTGDMWLGGYYQMWRAHGMSSPWSRVPQNDRNGVSPCFVVVPTRRLCSFSD